MAARRELCGVGKPDTGLVVRACPDLRHGMGPPIDQHTYAVGRGALPVAVVDCERDRGGRGPRTRRDLRVAQLRGALDRAGRPCRNGNQKDPSGHRGEPGSCMSAARDHGTGKRERERRQMAASAREVTSGPGQHASRWAGVAMVRVSPSPGSGPRVSALVRAPVPGPLSGISRSGWCGREPA